ncbi:unnamed protein product, partial [Prorocentrum cordatum]
EALVSACLALKAAVALASQSAGTAFQAAQLAQHAAPAVRTSAATSAPAGQQAGASAQVLPGPPRETLPIDEHRDEIVGAIKSRRVVCIQGETGCGKSSRVPQYVHFLCRDPAESPRPGEERVIVCTQPRRLAA